MDLCVWTCHQTCMPRRTNKERIASIDAKLDEINVRRRQVMVRPRKDPTKARTRPSDAEILSYAHVIVKHLQLSTPKHSALAVAEALYASSGFVEWDDSNLEAFDAAARFLGRPWRSPDVGTAAILRAFPTMTLEDAQNREKSLRAVKYARAIRAEYRRRARVFKEKRASSV